MVLEDADLESEIPQGLTLLKAIRFGASISSPPRPRDAWGLTPDGCGDKIGSSSSSSPSSPHGPNTHGTYVADTDANGSDNADSRVENSNQVNIAKFHSQVMSESKFMEELKACMYDAPRLQTFMEKAEYHPQYAWHKVLLLFGNAKPSNKRASKGPVLDEDLVNWFMNELLENFPDVLQRMLLRGAYAENNQNRFGPLHVAVMSNQPKIVELLTRVESKEQIRQCLVDSAKRSNDEFKCVERALFWSQLKETAVNTSHLHSLALLMTEFDVARRSGGEVLNDLISKATSYPGDGWRTVLLWASASGETHIVRMFKGLWPEVFDHIKYTSHQEGFSRIRINNSTDGSLKKKQEIHDLVCDLVDTVDDFSYRELCLQNLHNRVGDGWTALHVASILSQDAMLDVLIDRHNNLYPILEKVSNKVTTFSSPTKKRKSRAQKELQAESYDFDFSDDNWMNPMHYAVISEDVKIVKKFLNWTLFQPHLNDFNLFMCTSFLMACKAQNGSYMLHALMENPAIEVNVEDCCSFGPLHWAVYVQASHAIRFILGRGKDPERPIKTSQEDADGRLPFAIAVQNKSWKLLTNLPEVQNEVERLYRDRQVYVDAANTLLVGAALIAGGTFGGWLSPPAVTSYDTQYMRVFWAFNSLSFFISIAAIITGAIAVLPMEEKYIGNAVKDIREWLIITSFLFITSVILVLGAFTAAGFASIHMSIPHLWENMLSTTIFGCMICFTVGLMFMRKLYALSREWGKIQYQVLLNYSREILHRLDNGVWRPLTPGTYKLEYKIKEDWRVIGRKWKARQKDWKRYRGIHHLGYISTHSCRKHVLQYEKAARGKLQGECQRLLDLGTALAQEHWT